jgi:hypothetical protein
VAKADVLKQGLIWITLKRQGELECRRKKKKPLNEA